MSLTQAEIEKIAELVAKKIVSDQGEVKHWMQEAIKASDDVFLMKRVEDVAWFNKIKLTGPVPQYQPNPTAQDAGNPLIIHAYTFIPKTVEQGKKYPLLLLPHGGVHSNFNSSSAAIVRELVLQGYIVAAPDYRGSTGYGKGYFEKIDYGGLEVEDTLATRDHMVESCEFVDPDRVGILGWSHGGLHTLFNIFKYPKSYQAAYASVPVSDIIARMGYKSQGYRDNFEAKYHIGKSGNDNVAEYRRRSPAWNVTKLETPLLIHTTENDHDVNVLEVEHLIKSLIAKGNKPGEDFWYTVYPPTPGDHTFNRLDTSFAMGVRAEVYDFLAMYLEPENPNPLERFKGSPNPLTDNPDNA
jgi:dienelactone hydrolase